MPPMVPRAPALRFQARRKLHLREHAHGFWSVPLLSPPPTLAAMGWVDVYLPSI